MNPDRLSFPDHGDPLPSEGGDATPIRCTDFDRRLDEIERDGPESVRAAGRVPPGATAAGKGTVATDLAILRAHLDGCERCGTRRARRLADVEALSALRGREAPREPFEAFYEGIQQRIPFALAGGGMSRAFLDAPRSLARWRVAALAAGVLLAATLAWSLGAKTDAGATGVVPLHDPRHALLETVDVGTPRRLGPGSEVYDSPHARGSREFFGLGAPDARPGDASVEEVALPAASWR